MDTNTVKLFDSKNKFVENFDDEIEKILISIHGDDYYDTDETVNKNRFVDEELYLDKPIEIDDIKDEEKEIVKEEKKETIEKKKTNIKDFLPLLFFIIIAIIIVIAGYYFLNSVDLMNLFN